MIRKLTKGALAFGAGLAVGLVMVTAVDRASATDVGALAVADTHPAQKLADEARAHLHRRGYRCATRVRLVVVPAWRHTEYPMPPYAVAENRGDGSIIVGRRTIKQTRVRTTPRRFRIYNGDALDTMLHEYLHECPGGSYGPRAWVEGLVTIAADHEVKAFCAHRRRKCSGRYAYYQHEQTLVRSKIGWGRPSVHRARMLLRRAR